MQLENRKIKGGYMKSEKKKILFIANTGRFYHFEKNNMRLLREQGIEVHFAANFKLESIDDIQDDGIITHQIDCTRAPLTLQNITAYKQVCQIVKNEKIKLIHCHTPVGGLLGRLAALRYKGTGIKVIYSAHGFHFYKGAPFKFWAVIYPVEWGLSWVTDSLITINHEDYTRAKKNFHASELLYVPGIGIDMARFGGQKIDVVSKRVSLGFEKDDIILLAVGELNDNKNHEILIKALAQISNPKIKCCISGIGFMHDYLSKLIHKYHLENRVSILGYRRDIAELYQMANVFVFPSYREGLSAALMEAMASELPVICSDIRGNNDLIDNGKGGYRVSPSSVDQWVDAIRKMISERKNWKQYGTYNREKIQSNFSQQQVLHEMKSIYDKYLRV